MNKIKKYFSMFSGQNVNIEEDFDGAIITVLFGGVDIK